MSYKNLVCTGCSCLCDDIGVEQEGDVITRVENACRKGAAFIYAHNINERRNPPCLVKGERGDLTEALETATQLLRQAKKPLIFGLDNSTLEAQARAIELSRTLGATIDDCSSFCQGTVVENILTGTLPSCSFPQLKEADLLVYWGSNPYHSHPRHISRFAYYPFERAKPAGLSCVDVRDTELSRRCRHAFRLLPGEDRDFIISILTVIKEDSGREDARAFVELLKKSQFPIIFVGLGLTYALDGDFSLFQQLIETIKNILGIGLAVIPMACHTNMRGLNHLLYQQTGHVNKISFANGISHGPQFSFLEQVRNQEADCILIVGTDPYSSLPASLAKNLNRGISLITLDPYITPTSMHSTVVFGGAISGIEAGGRVVRMDGTEVTLSPIKETDRPSDEEIISRLLEGV